MSIQLMKEQIINNVQYLVDQLGFKKESNDELIKVFMLLTVFCLHLWLNDTS